MKQNECLHKSIFKERWIIDIDGKRFEMCKKCFHRIRHLVGIKIIEWGTPKPARKFVR